MPVWIVVAICLVCGLFAIKLIYLIATGWALPITQGALFVPTSSIRIEAFLDSVPMSSQDLFLDLGCGDGRVIRAAQRRYGVKALGSAVPGFSPAWRPYLYLLPAGVISLFWSGKKATC